MSVSKALTILESQLDVLEEESNQRTLTREDTDRLESVILRLNLITSVASTRLWLDERNDRHGKYHTPDIPWDKFKKAVPLETRPNSQIGRERYPDDFSFGISGIHLP